MKTPYVFLCLFLFLNTLNSQEIILEWNKVMGNTDESLAYGCETDLDGNIYYIGQFNGTLNLSGLMMESAPKQSNIYRDAYLLKVSPEGDILWSKQFSSYYHISLTSIVVDHDNNVYVLGGYRVKVEFDGHVMHTNNTDTLYSENTFLLKYAPNGSLIWAKNTGGASTSSRADLLAIDQGNNILITGKSIDFSLYDTPGPITTLDSLIYNVVGTDTIWSHYHVQTPFIAKYNDNGEQLWIVEAGGIIVDIEADYNNNIITTGFFHPLEATFAGQQVEPLGTDTGFITQYSANDGSLNWIRTFGS